MKLSQFFSVRSHVSKDEIQGEIPSDKEIYKKTLGVAWPSTLEAVLISLISSVDMIMVGSIGADAIASVGITNQPKFIILAVILSLNVGVTVVVSRRKGEQDKEAANRCLRQALMICIGAALVLSIAGIIWAKDILYLAGANDEYVDMAATYFKLIMVGNIFYSLSLTINAAQKGCGNTKISMRTNLTANVVNLIFNFLLINGIGFFPKLGVAGAAIATSLGNIVACVMSFMSLRHQDEFLHFSLHQSWRFDKKTLHDLYFITSSSFVEQVFMRIGFFLYSKTVATLGTIAFATHQVCMNIINLSFSFGDGLSVATSSLVGQSLGAKRKDMAKIYSTSTQKLGKVAAVLVGTFLIVCRYQILGLFTNDPVIIQTGGNIVFIIVLTVVFQITQVITFGCLRSAGDVKFTAMISLISVTAVRPVLTYLLAFPLGLGLIGAWLSLFLDQLIRYFASRMRYRKGNWVNLKV